MTSFINSHREQYGVEPICNVLPIAPSTYYEGMARETDHRRLPARARRDGELREQIRRVWKENFHRTAVRRRREGSDRPATPWTAAATFQGVHRRTVLDLYSLKARIRLGSGSPSRRGESSWCPGSTTTAAQREVPNLLPARYHYIRQPTSGIRLTGNLFPETIFISITACAASLMNIPGLCPP